MEGGEERKMMQSHFQANEWGFYNVGGIYQALDSDVGKTQPHRETVEIHE